MTQAIEQSVFTSDDSRYMARALQLARKGTFTTDPNPRVGCVVVKNETIVGEGWHERAGEPHAEIRALQAATKQTRDATVYLSMEPCCHHGRTPPCAPALIQAGVRRVVTAMMDPNPKVGGKGHALLREAGIEVVSGLLQTQAEAINPGFVSRMTRQRPYVRVKLAASLDGRTAMADGESKWITDEDARKDVQRWRARSSAVMTGIGTVLADDPSLAVRAFDIGRQPLRVVVDSQLRMPTSARMLQQVGGTLIVTAADAAKKVEALQRAGAEILHLPASGGVDLRALLQQLAAREVNECLVEAGPILCGSLMQAELIDEIVVYFAPHLMGSDSRPLFHLPGLKAMEDRVGLDIIDVRAVGTDWRIIAKISGQK